MVQADATANKYKTVDDCIRARPVSLTSDRAQSYLPTIENNPEWERKRDAGELPEGILGLSGMTRKAWPELKPTLEEAQWILALEDFGSALAGFNSYPRRRQPNNRNGLDHSFEASPIGIVCA